VYVDLQTQLKKANCELNCQLQLICIRIHKKDTQKAENVSQTTFEPRLTVNYDINPIGKLTFGRNFEFGTINQLHYGYILQNYRSIKRIDSPCHNPKFKILMWSFI
jgi:hypothetical protein